jgi:hypothetical protein
MNPRYIHLYPHRLAADLTIVDFPRQRYVKRIHNVDAEPRLAKNHTGSHSVATTPLYIFCAVDIYEQNHGII